MDFRSVTGLTILAGSVNKISIGGVVVWSKKNDGRYKILKDGQLIDRITIADLVSKVQDGSAQTDYGIGAQIVVPYHDPFDDNDYELPFNFGTFTAYGEGKLGLQAHYAVPNQEIQYKASTRLCEWKDSYICTWLNSDFLNCMPEDFSEAMISLKHGNTEETLVSSKMFILSLEASCASLDKVTQASPQPFYSDNMVWEYWSNKIGIPQKYNETNTARVFYKANGKSADNYIIVPNYLYTFNDKGILLEKFMCMFSRGTFNTSVASSYFFVVPACVIG